MCSTPTGVTNQNSVLDRDNSACSDHDQHATSTDREVVDATLGEFKISVISFDELSPDMLLRWEQIRRVSEQWEQPFFASRFTAAVQQARGDVSVAVISRAETDVRDPLAVVGFLPFHRTGRVAVPVGRFLNDAQNVIGLSPKQVDWATLMRACDVLAFDFHAIIHPASSWIEAYQLQSVGAFQADFEGDSQGYLRRLEKDHRTIGKQGQKTRKLGREIGPVRLEVDCRCPEVLARTIAWKRDQYQRTHILDLFLPDWTRRLIEVLHGDNHASDSPLSADGRPSDNLQNEPLRGLLSVLWAGETVVAAHFGMVERGRLHYWFPAYDPEFAQYSPGTALFTELVRASTKNGIDCIDMGYGEQPYKQKQTATATQVAFGTITDSRWHRFSYHTQRRLVDCLKRMPMKQTFKRAWRAVYPTAGIHKLG